MIIINRYIQRNTFDIRMPIFNEYVGIVFLFRLINLIELFYCGLSNRPKRYGYGLREKFWYCPKSSRPILANSITGVYDTSPTVCQMGSSLPSMLFKNLSWIPSCIGIYSHDQRCSPLTAYHQSGYSKMNSK